MTDPQPTAADMALAEEMFGPHGWEWLPIAEKKRIAVLIARHTTEQTASLRAEIEDLRSCRGRAANAESILRSICKEFGAANVGELPEKFRELRADRDELVKLVEQLAATKFTSFEGRKREALDLAFQYLEKREAIARAEKGNS